MKAYTLWYREEGKKYSQVFYAQDTDDLWTQLDTFLASNGRQYVTYTSGIVGCVINLIHSLT